jgi:hypothetical protein
MTQINPKGDISKTSNERVSKVIDLSNSMNSHGSQLICPSRDINMLAASSGHGESHSWNACTAMHEPANRKTMPLFRISKKKC